MNTQLIKLLDQQFVIAAQLRFIKAKNHIAFAHVHTVAHVNAIYNTARRMLYFLYIGFRNQDARYHDRTRQRHERPPTPDDGSADCEHPQADF